MAQCQMFRYVAHVSQAMTQQEYTIKKEEVAEEQLGAGDSSSESSSETKVESVTPAAVCHLPFQQAPRVWPEQEMPRAGGRRGGREVLHGTHDQQQQVQQQPVAPSGKEVAAEKTGDVVEAGKSGKQKHPRGGDGPSKPKRAKGEHASGEPQTPLQQQLGTGSPAQRTQGQAQGAAPSQLRSQRRIACLHS